MPITSALHNTLCYAGLKTIDFFSSNSDKLLNVLPGLKPEKLFLYLLRAVRCRYTIRLEFIFKLIYVSILYQKLPKYSRSRETTQLCSIACCFFKDNLNKCLSQYTFFTVSNVKTNSYNKCIQASVI